MTGAVLQAAAQRRVIVVDGFIASAAVLVAHALQPLVLQRCVFAHRSGERGHEFMLQHLGVQALLELGLRLGEGSGAALAWPLLQSACAILREMASFASAGVSEKSSSVVAGQRCAIFCWHCNFSPAFQLQDGWPIGWASARPCCAPVRRTSRRSAWWSEAWWCC